MNHAVGLSRGIKCGDNYNCIEEVKTEPPSCDKPGDKIEQPEQQSPKTTSVSSTEDKDHVTKTAETSYQKVEGKSTNVTFDEAKSSKKNPKKIHSY